MGTFFRRQQDHRCQTQRKCRAISGVAVRPIEGRSKNTGLGGARQLFWPLRTILGFCASFVVGRFDHPEPSTARCPRPSRCSLGGSGPSSGSGMLGPSPSVAAAPTPPGPGTPSSGVSTSSQARVDFRGLTSVSSSRPLRTWQSKRLLRRTCRRPYIPRAGILFRDR